MSIEKINPIGLSVYLMNMVESKSLMKYILEMAILLIGHL